jgi:hypothetical protein
MAVDVGATGLGLLRHSDEEYQGWVSVVSISDAHIGRYYQIAIKIHQGVPYGAPWRLNAITWFPRKRQIWAQRGLALCCARVQPPSVTYI